MNIYRTKEMRRMNEIFDIVSFLNEQLDECYIITKSCGSSHSVIQLNREQRIWFKSDDNLKLLLLIGIY